MRRAWLLLWISFSLAQAATLNVGPNGSIQAAIFTAQPGDVIVVSKGIYYEHLKVDKPITLHGQGMPLLDATASGSAITLQADGITVEGFRIINAGTWPAKETPDAGIVVLSSGNRITRNNVSNNFNGILLQSATNNSILDNNVCRNLGFGIRLESASNNTIANNILAENHQNAFDDGVNLWEMNHYGDFDVPREGCSDTGDGICEHGYAVAGGMNMDRQPRSKIL